MAITGRRPKPTKLRLLEGVPGHSRPINHREPQPTGQAEPPDFISGEAAKEWRRALSAMPDGVYTAADVPVLAVYCVAWVIYRNALAQVAQEGMTSVGSLGQKVAHPGLAVVATQAGIILRTGDRLCMSPGARSRLALQDAATGKFEGLFGGCS